jgi:hypothetical protein
MPQQDTHLKLLTGGLVNGHRIVMKGIDEFRDRDDFPQLVRYEIAISQAGLKALVRRANSNKSGKAVDGPVTVKIIF